MVKKAAKQVQQNIEDEMEHRVTILGEIATASGFCNPNTYVMFQVMLPEKGWVFEDVNEYE